MTSGNVIDAYSSVQVQTAVADALEVARSDDELIRKAAFGLAQACLAELRDKFGSAHGRSVVLLVGTGKNGADAMVLTRSETLQTLYDRWEAPHDRHPRTRLAAYRARLDAGRRGAGMALADR